MAAPSLAFRLALAIVAFVTAVVMVAATALAASGPTPSISLVSPKNGSVIHGAKLTVHVKISNFTLVKPSATTTGTSKSDTGHIQYVLDNASNFKPGRDATTSLIHSWTGVPPGPHTLRVYLANNQYVTLPGVKAATASITVISAPASKGHTQPHAHKPTVTPVRSAIVATAVPRPTQILKGAPRTGGAADLAHSTLNLSLLMAGVLLIAIGVMFFMSRRVAVATPTAGGSAILPPASPGNFHAATQESAGEGSAPPTDSFADSRATSLPEERSVAMPAPTDPHADPLRVAAIPPMPGTTSTDAMVSTEAEGESSHDVRAQAMGMARQWTSVVEELITQSQRQEAERLDLLAQIARLEASASADEGLQEMLDQIGADNVTDEELTAVQYVVESLVRDPDHIVVLAGISQNAERLHRIVSNYAKLQRSLRRPSLRGPS